MNFIHASQCINTLQINGNDLREVQHHKAVAYFHSAGNRVILLVERGAEQRITVSAIPHWDEWNHCYSELKK